MTDDPLSKLERGGVMSPLQRAQNGMIHGCCWEASRHMGHGRTIMDGFKHFGRRGPQPASKFQATVDVAVVAALTAVDDLIASYRKSLPCAARTS